MNLRKLVLSLICILLLGTSYAQDKLYKKNGDMIQVKVIEIETRTISYKKTDNPDGPSYTINKDDVAKIAYSNGTEDIFSNGRIEPSKPKQSKNYGNNILSVMPMQITSNIGVGVAYERVLDKNAVLSFYMPVTVAFPVINDINTGNTAPPGGGPTFFIMPGLKFYPTGGKGVVRYAVGPNLTYITGQKHVNDFIYDEFGNITGQDIGWRKRTALGIMITNGLNINPSEHIHMGLELGLGFTYFNTTNGVNSGTIPLAQFGFKIGYRF